MTATLIVQYLGQGLAASRPATPSIAAGACGFYVATDTGAVSVYAGGVWAGVGGGGTGGIDQYNPPLASIFTLTSVGSPATPPSLTDVPGLGMVFAGGTSITAADNLQTAVLNVPAAPYSKSVRFRLNVVASRARGAGLILSDGTKFKTFGYIANSNGEGLAVTNYTNSTTFSAYLFDGAALRCWGAYPYLRIRDDNTNWYYEISGDGQNWTRFAQETRNTFLTATKIGLYVNTADVSGSVAVGDIPGISVQWWL